MHRHTSNENSIFAIHLAETKIENDCFLAPVSKPTNQQQTIEKEVHAINHLHTFAAYIG